MWDIFFEIQKRVIHLKLNKTPRKQGAFGFAFGVPLSLWQKRAPIMSKTKTRKMILGREDKNNITVIMIIWVYRRR